MPKTIGSNLDFGGTVRIVNLPDPTSAQHAATKAYVDSPGRGVLSVGTPAASIASQPRASDERIITADPASDIAVHGLAAAKNGDLILFRKLANSNLIDLPDESTTEPTAANRWRVSDLGTVRLQRANECGLAMYENGRWSIVCPAPPFCNTPTNVAGEILVHDGLEWLPVQLAAALQQYGPACVAVGDIAAQPIIVAATTPIIAAAYTIPQPSLKVGSTYRLTMRFRFTHGTANATPIISYGMLTGTAVQSWSTTPTTTDGTYTGEVVTYIRFDQLGSTGQIQLSLSIKNTFGVGAINQISCPSGQFGPLNCTIDVPIDIRVWMQSAVASNNLGLLWGSIERLV